MSEREFNRCDMECEQIFRERDLKASIMERVDALAREREANICKVKAAAVKKARQRKSWEEASWLAAVMIGICTALCAMYIVFHNTPMAVMTGVMVAGFLTAYEITVMKAKGYKGKRVKR